LDTLYNLKFILADAIEKMFNLDDPLVLTSNINFLLFHLEELILKKPKKR